ncbi:hypothetical protein TcCL_NonESM05868, partial [Trypanosoma cruzi]
CRMSSPPLAGAAPPSCCTIRHHLLLASLSMPPPPLLQQRQLRERDSSSQLAATRLWPPLLSHKTIPSTTLLRLRLKALQRIPVQRCARRRLRPPVAEDSARGKRIDTPRK